jgi:uncharacterized lipoprotein YmbA
MATIDKTLLGMVALVCSGCLSQNAPPTVRFFHPAPLAAPPASAAASTGEPLPVRIGHVSAAPYLGDRMVVRVSDVEIGFDELHRWASPPDVMVEDALRRLLVPENGFVVSGSLEALVVDAHVAAFEGVSTSKSVSIEIELTLERHGGGDSSRGTVRVTRPTNVDDPVALAKSAGEALGEASQKIALWLRQARR